MDQRIQAIFIAPEPAAIFSIMFKTGLIQARDVTTSAKGACPSPVNHHMANLRVITPGQQRALQVQTHIMGQGIQRLRTVQCDPAGAPVNPALNVAH
jgi:hypothetical protein